MATTATTTPQQQRHPACKGVARRSPAWGIIIVIVAVIAAAMIVFHFGSSVFDKVNSSAAAPGASQQYTVGEQDEVAIRLPPRSGAGLSLTGTVILRLNNNKKFEWRKDSSIFEIGPSGGLTAVESVGDSIPGSTINLLAKKGEKMVTVSVMSVKK